MLKKVIPGIVVLVLLAGAGNIIAGEKGGKAEVKCQSIKCPIVSKYKAVFDKPAGKVPTTKTVDGPILGNGDVGVVIGGAPQSQRFWISKCDFWKANPGNHKGGGPKMIGGVDISIPAMAGASYHAEQILAEPEIRSTFSKADGSSVVMRSWVAASEDLLVIELVSKGKAVKVKAKPWVKSGDDSTTAQGTWKSMMPNGTWIDVQWATRAYLGDGLDWPTGAAIAVRCLETDSNAFTLEPGQTVTVAVAIRTNHETSAYRDDARKRVVELTCEKIESIRSEHVKWWRGFWSKSFVEIPDKLVEKFYYGSQYIMACCSRNKAFPPGLFGNWTTTDKSAWQADYHMNYNHESPWWGCYSSNHIDLTEPYDTPLMEFIPRGRFYAKRDLNCRGIYYPVGIGPKGLATTRNPLKDRAEGEDRGHFMGAKSHAAFAATNMVLRFYHTYDLEYAKNIAYPYMIEVADFWQDYLKFENNRYVIYKDHHGEISESKEPDDMNNNTSLGLIQMVFATLIEMSQELNVDAGRRGKWQHILDHISKFPTYQSNGKTLFRHAEKGRSSRRSPAGWQCFVGLVWPSGVIGLNSDPEILEIAKNTVMAWSERRWIDSGNNFPLIFPAATRVGHDPTDILSKLRKKILKFQFPNLRISQVGGGIETCTGITATINEMLLQSHEKVLFFFPVWPKEMDARFGSLRAVGAFLVSSEIKQGRVQYKGRPCTMQNPWLSQTVSVLRNGRKAGSVKGTRFTLQTKENEEIYLQPN